MKALITIAVIVGLLLLFAVLYMALRSGGVRRAEHKRRQTELGLAVSALDQIEEKADHYRDIDSPLATDVREIVRGYRKKCAAIHNQEGDLLK